MMQTQINAVKLLDTDLHRLTRFKDQEESMAISVSLNGKEFEQVVYSKEDTFEQLIAQNSQTIFGDKAIYIDAKKKVNTSSFGGTIPDGFLIDLSDPDDPQFYLVEVELQSHDFFRHIFPQITKFFAFFRDPKQRTKLIETIFAFMQENFVKNINLSNKVIEIIKTNEVYKFLKDTMDNGQNILIVIDGPKPEFKEIMDTYTDTWGRMVKVQIVKHFQKDNSNILTVEPPFQAIPYEDATSPSPDGPLEPSQYTEELHLEDCVANIKDIYNRLKNDFLSVKSTLKFNPVKYYIGVRDLRNIAAIRFRKRKLLLEVILPENEVREMIKSKHHEIRICSSRSPFVEIYNTSDWDEIHKLIIRLVQEHQE
jgi:predicted transport protein